MDTDLLSAISAVLTERSFTPNQLLSRTWVKPYLLVHPSDKIQVLYIHRYDLPEVRLTIWEGSGTSLDKLGTYQVNNATEFVDLLADCSWL